MAQIKQVDTMAYEKQIIDAFGRVTFFYGMLGPHKITIYQPQTVMFKSLLIDQSELMIGEPEVTHKEGINTLQGETACTLAMFVGNLIFEYKKSCEENEQDHESEELFLDSFETALDATYELFEQEQEGIFENIKELKDTIMSIATPTPEDVDFEASEKFSNTKVSFFAELERIKEALVENQDLVPEEQRE